MKLIIALVLVNAVAVSSFDCYSCNDQLQNGCTEEAPDTSSLRTVSCNTKCFKWVIRSPNSQVKRGCSDGSEPSASSYSEYECNSNLCNRAPDFSISYLTMALLVVISLFNLARLY